MNPHFLIFVLACVACLTTAIVVLSWAAAYLLEPGVLYLSQRLEARATIVPTPIEMFPVEARRWACATVEALAFRGFEPRASVLLPHYVPDLSAFVVLMHNPSTGDQATISAIFNRHAEPLLKAKYIEFSTRFENGLCVDTLNSPILGFVEHGPESIKTWLPDVFDPRLLYRMHRHICASSAAGSAPIFEAEEEGAVYLVRILARECEEQRELGLLALDRERAMFHPTYKGACWTCWSQLWPVSSLRRSGARRAAARRLVGFNIDVISSRKYLRTGACEAEDAGSE